MSLSRRSFMQASGALAVYFTLPGCAPGNAGGSAQIGSRLILSSSGSVTVNLGKVELGQGIGTAIAQIAAEELGVEFDRINISAVDTDYSPDESYTFSTISIQQSGPPMRRAAATGRQFLLQRASESAGIDIADLSVRDGEVFSAGTSTGIDYWQLLAGKNLEIDSSEESEFVPVADHRVVGQSIGRLDIPGKVFGEAIYLQDVRLPGMLHARVVLPPAERARLESINVTDVEKMPGVVKVVRDGNFLAVVADREQQARNAAASLRDSASWETADDLPEAARIYDWLKTAKSRTEEVVARQADVAVAATMKAAYRRPYQAHASISPAAAIAQFADHKLTIWSHAQGMYPLREAIAHVLNLDIENVRCVHREAAGCFGHDGADDAACDVAAIAMQVPGKPIRLQWERSDEFAWEPYGPAMHIEMQAGVDDTGAVQSWQHDIWSCPHTSRPRDIENAGNFLYTRHRADPLPIPPARSIPQPSGGADRNAVPLYSFQSTVVNKHLVTDVPIRVSSLRGLGAYANVFAIESFMDELAASSETDPIEYRMEHLDDARAVELLQALARVSGWRKRPAPGGGEGWGVGFARFKNLASYLGVVFKLNVDSDGGAIRLTSAIAVCDAGLVVNPDGASAQIEGGIVQSASWTVKEQVRFSRSGIESRDWAGYPILRFDEVPHVEVHLLSRDDQPSLGVGEVAQGPTAAAIANAIFHATGRRLRELPFTPDKVRA